MKKIYIHFTFILVLGVSIHSSINQDIIEELEIKWWVVPFYVLNNSTKAVQNLKENDLILKINNQPIDNYIIYYRKKIEMEINTVIEPTKKKNQKNKRKLVFLVFDDLATQSLHVKKAKTIAKGIIQKSPPNFDFVALCISRYKGLEYIIGPTGNKELVINQIYDKIKGWAKESQLLNRRGGLRDISKFPGERNYDDGTSYYFRKKKYFISLETLDTLLKVFMGEGKIVYFFTTGIHAGIGRGHDFLQLRDIAQKFNENGSLLFVINPVGVRNISGENAVRYLAKASGGKYFEGTKDSISNRIVEMNRGYYEIAFPDPNDDKRIIDVELLSKKKNMNIYSVRKLSRGKHYLELNETERSLLPLNMIENGYWAKSIYDITYHKLKPDTKDDQHICSIDSIPESFLNHENDIFLIRINP
ncbi:MAG: hypothetical protein GF317_06735, partial [Candidatus Lokiarchaeota archaeon]|nr:hypothetical protein [Candidatus Lokiarchaeota archaeon]